MRRVDTPIGRHYETQWGTFPSVTTVLGATKSEESERALQKWRDKTKNHKQVFEDAGRRGTFLHARVEKMLRGERLPEFSEEERGLLVPQYWKSIYPVVRRIKYPTHIETMVAHPEQGYAGTLDCGAQESKGSPRRILWDWKNALKYKPREWIEDYFCQVAAYSVAARLSLPDKPSFNEARIVIALPDREATIHVMDRRDLSRYYTRFIARLGQFRRLGSDHALPRNPSTVRLFQIRKKMKNGTPV